GSRIVNFGRTQDAVRVVAAGDQNLARIFSRRNHRGLAQSAGGAHRRTGRKCVGGRIVKLGRRQVTGVGARAAGEQYLPRVRAERNRRGSVAGAGSVRGRAIHNRVGGRIV